MGLEQTEDEFAFTETRVGCVAGSSGAVRILVLDPFAFPDPPKQS